MITFPIIGVTQGPLARASRKPLIFQVNLPPDPATAKVTVAIWAKTFCPVACAVKKMPLQ